VRHKVSGESRQTLLVLVRTLSTLSTSGLLAHDLAYYLHAYVEGSPISREKVRINVSESEEREITWECDECFATWEDEALQVICSVCGSMFVYSAE